MGVLTVAALGWVGSNLVVSARRAFRLRAHVVDLLVGLRPRHLWPAPFVLASVVAVFALAWLVPALRFGWWTLLGGQGNVVFGTTDQTQGTVFEVLIPVVFVLLLLPALPLLVEAEERRFRFGAEGWSTGRRALRGLQFGLLHLVVGIPVAAALGITVAGWWFTRVYLRAFRASGSAGEALAESTRAHLGYDLVVIGLVAASLVLSGCSLPDPSALRLESPDMGDGARLAERFTCSGDNAVPTLGWRGGPTGVQGWAVVVEDPDAPRGTFTHWLVTGLGATTRSVSAQLPGGAIAGLTSSGQPGYVGPCPPTGQTHHYRFRVHALAEPLTLGATTSVLEARRRIEALSLDAAEIEVTYRAR